MLLLVLAHIDADHGALIIEEEFGQGTGQLGLTHAGGAEKDKRANRPVGVLQTGARATDGVGYGAQGVFLTDHPGVQAGFHLHQLFDLTFQQAGDGDACPAGNHLADLFSIHFFFEQRSVLLDLFQAVLAFRQARFQLAQCAITQAGGIFQLVFTFSLLHFQAGLLNFFLGALQAGDGLFFGLPAGVQLAGMLLQIGQLFFDALQALFGGLILFFLEGLTLDFKLHDLAVHLVQSLRFGVDLGPQAGGGLVDQIDGFVRQMPVGDITAGEGGSGNHRRVGDAHAVVHLITLLEAAQDADGLFYGRLIHQNGLEAALQGGVFFHMLAVFVNGRGADHMQLTARQHGLEHVAGIHGAFGGAGSHHSVHFIHKEDDRPGGFGDLFENGLEALFELAAILGAGYQGAHIELHQAFAFQAFWNIAVDHALRQPFNDGGFTHAGVADESRVVLGAPGEDLDDPADLLITPDDRIHLALASQGSQVTAVFFESLVGGFGILRGNTLRATHVFQSLEDGILGQAILHQAAALSALGERQQNVLGRDVIVLHGAGMALGGGQNISCRAGKPHFGSRAVDTRAGLQVTLQVVPQGQWAACHLGDDGGSHAVFLLQQGQKQVGRFDRLVIEALRQALRAQHGFLRFLGIFVQVHNREKENRDLRIENLNLL